MGNENEPKAGPFFWLIIGGPALFFGGGAVLNWMVM